MSQDSSMSKESKSIQETVFYEGGPAKGDLVFNLLLGLTLIGIPGWGKSRADPDQLPPGYDLAGTLKVGNALALGDTTTGTRLTIQTEDVDVEGVLVTRPLPGLEPGQLDLNGYTIFDEILRFEGDYARPLLVNTNTSTAAGWTGTTAVIAQAGIGGPGDIEMAGVISGDAGTLAKVGAGTVILSAANTFAGGIAVEQGTLVVGPTGSVADVSLLTTSAGATLDLTAGGPYTLPATQVLGGSGTVLGSVAVASGGTLSPGESPGSLAITQGIGFGPSGNYEWQMVSATGTAGIAWDTVTTGGPLTITAISGDPFAIDLGSLASTGPDVDGPVGDFNAGQAGNWTIATAAGGINGFAADAFVISTARFVNDLQGGSFSLAVSGNDLNLVFAPGSGPSDIVIDVPSGSQIQAQAGYPAIGSAGSVTKIGLGVLVMDAVNSYAGPTTVSAGTLEVAIADDRHLAVEGFATTRAEALKKIADCCNEIEEDTLPAGKLSL